MLDKSFLKSCICVAAPLVQHGIGDLHIAKSVGTQEQNRGPSTRQALTDAGRTS